MSEARRSREQLWGAYLSVFTLTYLNFFPTFLHTQTQVSCDFAAETPVSPIHRGCWKFSEGYQEQRNILCLILDFECLIIGVIAVG
jgi:hypothetical protein